MKDKMNGAKAFFKSIATCRFKTALILTLFALALQSTAQAQSIDDKSWHFVVAPYVLFPSMNGDVAINGIPIDVSASPGDIFSNLNWGAMIYSEAHNHQWAITFDVLYMNLGKEGETPLLNREVTMDMDQLAVTAMGLYRLTPWLEAGIGARVNSINTKFKVAPGDIILPGTNVSVSEAWFDPLIVARAMTRFDTDKWRLGLVTNIGGFGIGSDFAWEINPFGGYQFSKLFEIELAWRWLGMKYDTGSDTDYFLYDMIISGPEIGFIFHL